MKIRREQIEALRQSRLENFRATQLQDFRERGYKAELDPQTQEVVLEDAAGGRARIAYADESIAVTTADERTTRTEHDQRGRLKAITDPAGLRVGFEEDRHARSLDIHRGQHSSYRLEFDEQRNLTAAIYPDKTSTRFAYDTEGRIVFITDRNGNKTRYGYTSAGLMARRIDAGGHITRFEQDDAGQFAAIHFADGSRQDFEFDEEDNLRRMLFNGKEHAKFRIDEEAGSYEVEYADGARARFLASGGRVVEAANETCTVKLAYDEHGKLLREEIDGQVVEFERNAVGALTGLTTPDGEKLVFERDGDQTVRSITDWSGGQYAFKYSKVGVLAAIEFPNGATLAQTATQMGLTETLNISSPMSFGSIISHRWEYDTCDRVKRMADGKSVREYRYDGEGRLLGVDGADAKFSHRFELDANGNRLLDDTEACQYNSLNQLMQRGESSFAYDERGNLTGGPTPKQSRARYTYNGRDQLTSVEINGIKTTYAYDAFGRRVRKETEGKLTRYVWAGPHLLSETTTIEAKQTRRDYLFHPDRPFPLAMRAGQDVFYLHAGRLAEPLCVTDARGDVVWQAEYDAFGEAHVSTAKVSQPFRLAGQYFDEETGLHYTLARYYDPRLGRYLTQDPMRVEGGSLNFYTYCDGDPLNRLDPTGEIVIPAILIAIAIGAAVGAVIGAAIGGGVEAYKQYKTSGEITDWGKVGKSALIGGVVGAIGGAVGGAFPPAGATIAATLGLGAAAGGISSGVEYCAEVALTDQEFDPKQLGLSVLIGAGVGAVTAGIGGLIAAKLARRAARKAAEEATEKAAKEAAEKEAQEELRRKAIKKIEAARRAKPDPEKVAKVGEPSTVNTYRPREVPYHNPPDMMVVNPGQKLDTSKLDPNKKYLWVVDKDGNVIIAPENQPGFGAKEGLPNGRDVKHGDLVPGPGGQTRGEARAGGELTALKDSDGNYTGDWLMNNDSSYTFNRTDGQTGTGENLNAAADLLDQSKTSNSGAIFPHNTSGADAPQ